jgi:hypothetical protein
MTTIGLANLLIIPTLLGVANLIGLTTMGLTTPLDITNLLDIATLIGLAMGLTTLLDVTNLLDIATLIGLTTMGLANLLSIPTLLVGLTNVVVSLLLDITMVVANLLALRSPPSSPLLPPVEALLCCLWVRRPKSVSTFPSESLPLSKRLSVWRVLGLVMDQPPCRP